MRIRSLSFLTVILSAGLSVASAQTVTNVNWYHAGEADASPVNGAPVNSFAVDSGTAANNMFAAGRMTYDSSSVAPSANLRFGASTFSYDFPGSFSISSSFSTALTSDFGMEAWVNPASASVTQSIFLNGNGGNGYGLYILDGNYQVLFGGLAFHDTGVAVTPGVWTQFAFVNQFGSNTMYINGVSVGGTFSSTPVTPSGAMYLGGDSVSGFNGQIDEARIFTWSPGFSVTDLNYQVAAIPEPSTYGLIGSLAALGCAAWKKRRKVVKA